MMQYRPTISEVSHIVIYGGTIYLGIETHVLKILFFPVMHFNVSVCARACVCIKEIPLDNVI